MHNGTAQAICGEAIKRRGKRRESYLERACGCDLYLRDTVETMIALATEEGSRAFVNRVLRSVLSEPLPLWDAGCGCEPKKVAGKVIAWSFAESRRPGYVGPCARWIVQQPGASDCSPYYELMVSADQASFIVSHGNRRCGTFSYHWHIRKSTVIEFEALFYERDATDSCACLCRTLRAIFERETPNNDWPT